MNRVVENFRLNLQAAVAKKEAGECSNIFQNALKSLSSNLDESTVELLLLSIFEDDSLSRFLVLVISDKKLLPALKDALDLITHLLENFKARVQDTPNIRDACVSLLHSSIDASEKIQCLKIIEIFVEGNFFDTNIDDIQILYKKLFKRIFLQAETSRRVSERIYVVLGLIARNFCVAIANESNLFYLFKQRIQFHLFNKKNKCLQIIKGCLEGLCHYLHAFPFDPVGDVSECNWLYDCLKTVITQSEAENRNPARAALFMVSVHSSLFSTQITTDFDWWENITKVWLERLDSNQNNKRVALAAKRSINKEVINGLKDLSASSRDEILQRFLSKYMDIISKPTSKEHEMKEAIDWVESVTLKNILERRHITDVLIVIVTHMEYLNSIEELANSEKFQYLPGMLQIFSNIICSLETVTEDQINLLHQAVVLLIKVYPSLPGSSYWVVGKSLIKSLSRIVEMDATIFDELIEKIVYQGVLWSCSGYMVFEAEISESLGNKLTTCRSFLPLWKALVTISPLAGDDIAVSLATRKILREKIFEQLMMTLFVLFNKLNVGITTKAEDVSDPEKKFQAICQGDYNIFVNVVDFYCGLLDVRNAQLFKRYVKMYAGLVVEKSLKHPLVSGFYKLLTACLVNCEALSFFDEHAMQGKEARKKCFDDIKFYVDVVLSRMNSYKGDLQLSCIKLMLALPSNMVSSLVALMIPAFKSLLTIGRSEIKVVDSGVETLKKWYLTVPSEELKPLLEAVLPYLDLYLRTKNFDVDSKSSISYQRGKRSKYRRVIVASDNELVTLQHNILSFIGRIDSDICTDFNSQKELETVLFDENSSLVFNMNFSGSKLSVSMDRLLPRILELSSSSSHLNTRIGACQTLRSITVLVLGTGKLSQQSKAVSLKPVLAKLAPALMRLGCDSNILVSQMFSSFVIEIMHWMASPLQVHDCFRDAFVDAVFDAISSPTDCTLRDFGGLCLKEYVAWSIRHESPKVLSVLKQICGFCSDPNPKKRLAAAIAFNNTYRVIREEDSILSIYGLELLYTFFSNLKLCTDETASEILLSLSHIERILKKKQALFNSEDRNRKKPKDFGGVLLKDCVHWLLIQSGANNSLCCKESLRLSWDLVGFLSVPCELREFIHTELHVTPTHWLVDLYERDGIRYQRSVNIEDFGGVLKFMEHILRALDGYVWAVHKSLISLEELYELDSGIFDCIESFISKIYYLSASNFKEISIIDRKKFKSLRLELIQSIVQFLLDTAKKSKSSSYDKLLTNTVLSFLNECLFNPTSVGCAREEFQRTLIALFEVLQSVQMNASEKFFMHSSSYILANMDNSIDIAASFVPAFQRNILKGLLMMEKMNFFYQYPDVISYDNTIILSIFNGLIISSNGKLVPRSIHGNVKEYLETKLKLILSFGDFTTTLLLCISSSNEIYQTTRSRITSQGILFLECFNNIIMNHLASHNFGAMDTYFNSESDKRDKIYFINKLLTYVRDHKHEIDDEKRRTLVDVLKSEWLKLGLNAIECNREQAFAGISVVRNLMCITPDALYKIGTPEIEAFIMGQCVLDDNATEDVCTLMEGVFQVFPCLRIANNSSIFNFLHQFKTQFFNNVLKEKPCMQERLIQRILESALASQSYTIMMLAAECYLNVCLKCNLGATIEKILKKYVKIYSNDEYMDVVDDVYNISCSLANSSEYQEMFIFYKTFTQPFYHYVPRDAVLNIFHRYSQKVESSIRNAQSESYKYTCLHLMILEKLCLRTDFELLESEKKEQLYETTLDIFHKDMSMLPSEVALSFHSFAYNALASIVINANIGEAALKSLFSSRDIFKFDFWKKIVDCSKVISLPATFDELPQKKSFSSNIRSGKTNDVESSAKQNIPFMSSQNLFLSNLSEDVSKYDFTNYIIRSEPAIEALQLETGFAVDLWNTDFNDHDCMSTVCGILKYLGGITPSWNSSDDAAVPFWVENLRELLMDELVHPNVKIFWAKAILNMKHIFANFAASLFKPLAKLMISGNLGHDFNYFVADLLKMFVSWSLPVEDAPVASELFAFLVNCSDQERNVISKYALQMTEKIFHVWKDIICIPHDLILNKLIEKRLSGCILCRIVLQNGKTPWESNPQQFIEILSELLDSYEKENFIAAAKAVGLALHKLEEDYQISQQMLNKISTKLETLKSEKFYSCLYEISLNYEKIVDPFLGKLAFSLQKLPLSFKAQALQCLVKRFDHVNEVNFALIDILKLLNEKDTAIQVQSLKLVEASVQRTDSKTLFGCLDKTVELTDCNAAECRKAAYSVAMAVYDKYSRSTDSMEKQIFETAKTMLLCALEESDEGIQEAVCIFFSDQKRLPESLIERFPKMVQNLYSPLTEQFFARHLSYFLLDALKLGKDFNENLFRNPLCDSNFIDQTIVTDWRLSRASQAPMFAESQLSEHFARSKFVGIRLTQSLLNFTPTLAEVEADTTLSSEHGEEIENVPRESKYEYSRYVKNQQDVSHHFAARAYRSNLETEKRIREKPAEKAMHVKLYRGYRKGDIPDIEILNSALILPLQGLAKCDNSLARIIFSLLFDTFVAQLKNPSGFLAKMWECFTSFLNRSEMFVPSAVSIVFDSVVKSPHFPQFGYELICQSSRSSGLYSVGSLILEDYLSNSDLAASSSKQHTERCNDLDVSIWEKMAELYKDLNEWDIVHSILIEKMDLDELILQAFKAESSGQWREAQRAFSDLLQRDSDRNSTRFYFESFSNCCLHLSDWKCLSDGIESHIGLNKIWDDDWKKEKALNWYITSQVNGCLSGEIDKNALSKMLNQWLNDTTKLEYLKEKFSGDLAAYALVQCNDRLAKKYSNNYYDVFLESWSHLNPLLCKSRKKHLTKLNSYIEIFQYLGVISEHNSGDVDQKIKQLFLAWNRDDLRSSSDILVQETKSLYRRQISACLRSYMTSSPCVEKTDSHLEALKVFESESNFRLVQTALRDKNHFLAEIYLNKITAASEEETLRIILFKSRIDYLMASGTTNCELKAGKIADAVLHLRPLVCEYESRKYPQIFTESALLFFDISEELQSSKYADPALNQLKDQFHCTSLADVSDDALNVMSEIISLHKDNKNMKNQLSEVYVKLARFHHRQYFSGKENDMKWLVCYTLKAMAMDAKEARYVFPYILQLDMPVDVFETYLQESQAVPTWMFLSWIPQLLALAGTEKIPLVNTLLKRISKTYPHALLHSYRMSKTQYQKLLKPSSELQQLIEELDRDLLYERFNSFVQAMNFLCSPYCLLGSHLSKILEMIASGENYKDYWRENDKRIFSDGTGIVGKAFKVLNPFRLHVQRIIGESLGDDSLKARLTELRQRLLSEKGSLSNKLSDYSPWLASFATTFSDLDLEIPGQYKGDRMPHPKYHVKIFCFEQQVTVLETLRKPFKVNMCGNDSRNYPFLVKLGEDLRQDQRIQQIFNIMNDILDDDRDCSRKGCHIKTYQVIPLEPNLGLIEWVHRTVSLLDLVKRSGNNTMLAVQKAGEDYQQFVFGNRKKTTVADAYGNVCAGYSRDKIISKFRALVSTLPSNLLRNALWSMCPNAETFFALRTSFMRSYSAMCIAHWILGIGDRNLNNCLVCTSTGLAMGVDFDISFGCGTQDLPVPEMVPFRLTPQLLNIMGPLQEVGLVKNTMVRVLKALRREQHVLLAALEVFVCEPTMNWMNRVGKNGQKDGQGTAWCPQERISHVRRKLKGCNPVAVVVEELRYGHASSAHLEHFVAIAEGSERFNLRSRTAREELSEEEQVECLLDFATDYHVLGRMFAGWMPWI